MEEKPKMLDKEAKKYIAISLAEYKNHEVIIENLILLGYDPLHSKLYVTKLVLEKVRDEYYGRFDPFTVCIKLFAVIMVLLAIYFGMK